LPIVGQTPVVPTQKSGSLKTNKVCREQ
jgi:hypothetical protein